MNGLQEDEGTCVGSKKSCFSHQCEKPGWDYVQHFSKGCNPNLAKDRFGKGRFLFDVSLLSVGTIMLVSEQYGT